MNNPFFSIGHSTRTIEEFVALLGAGSVDFVVDIRTVPRSRTNPQYNTDTVGEELAPYQIGYAHFPELGGLRKKSKDRQDSTNAFWSNRSFHNYADYAMTPPFLQGLQRLVHLGRQRRVAMMCSEAVWWRCHRRIVADYLLARGEIVFHLMGEKRVDPATLTRGAQPRADGTIIYPPMGSAGSGCSCAGPPDSSDADVDEPRRDGA